MLINIFKNYQDEKIVILGLGTETRQFLEWALKIMKISPKIFILADEKPIKVELLEKMNFFEEGDGFDPKQMFFGDNYEDALHTQNVQYVIKSPGIWSNTPSLMLFREAKGDDRVISSLACFFEYFGNSIIGVTGTKGKSTTSGLITNILKNTPNKDAIYCGNSTNISPYKYWDTPDKKINSGVYFVIELSSFQLQDLNHSSISPRFAVITNYYIDHQDQHETPEEYWHAKDAIYSNQKKIDLIVTNQLPQYVQNKATQIVEFQKNSELIDGFNISLIGEHNKLNILLAIFTVAHLLEMKPKDFVTRFKSNIQKSLDTFKNLPFRLELTHEIYTSIQINNVTKKTIFRFINDGAATEPDAVVAGLGATSGKLNEYVWVIFTGKDKGGSVDNIIAKLLTIQKHNQLYRVDYCGEIGQKILQKTYQKMNIPISVPLENFHETTEQTFTNIKTIKANFNHWIQETYNNLDSLGFDDEKMKITKPDEIILNILLSPCGSSFDEFQNYIERSEFWNSIIKKL
jgi:UDP-N-acetylmuramoyl-L-alanine---L-glutamate ligase